jgi:hypothetical protein
MAIVQPNFKTSTSFHIRWFHLLSCLFMIIPFVITITINIVIIVGCSISIGFYLCCYVLYIHKLPCLMVTGYTTGRNILSKLLLKTNVWEECGIFKALSLGTASFKLRHFKFCALSPAPHQLFTDVLLPTMIAYFSWIPYGVLMYFWIIILYTIAKSSVSNSAISNV